jgi:PAS domain S-box-containing protein
LKIGDSQRFLSTLISNLPGYVYRCQAIDGVWCTQFVSDGILELTGYHASDFLKEGKMVYGELVHPADRSRVKEEVTDALRTRKPYQITYRIRTADGSEKWVWEQGRGISDDKGNVIATEGFITDITDRRIAEEEVFRRNEELSTLNLVGQSLSKLAKQSEILELINQMTGRLFDIENFYIALYEEETEEISFPIYTIEGKNHKRSPRRFGKGVTEYVIQSRKPLLIEKDIERVMSQLGIEMLGEKSKSLLAVPIKAGENIHGVIALQDYQKENAFSESQAELLMTVASQAAIALENSRLVAKLHKELREREETEKKLKASLREKEILLQEVHHRVKNNLQIMSSLLRLQASNVAAKGLSELFSESENRIKSMVIIHNKLYNSKNYERIDFGDYVKTLVDNLFLSFGKSKDRIKLNIDIKNIKFNIDTAIPCGLIINELVSNAFKYAFPDERRGNLIISLTASADKKYELKVEDDGDGMPEKIDLQSDKTLGIKLVHLLTNQIGGSIDYQSQNGTKYVIEFKEVTYKNRREMEGNEL